MIYNQVYWTQGRKEGSPLQLFTFDVKDLRERRSRNLYLS